MERLLGYVLLLALGAGSYLAEAAGDTKAADLLRQARIALGGEAAVDNVRTLSATGTVTRVLGGGTRIDGDLTLELALPDRMLRTESLSPDGGMTLVTTQGVNGDTLLRSARTFNTPPGAIIRTPPPPARGSDAEREALRAARADLARLTIALLARAPGTLPVDFTYAGQAEAPDGRADVLDVTATDGGTFAAKLFLDAATHRPLMLSYRGVAPRLVMQTRRLEGPPPRDGRVPDLPPPTQGDVVDIELFLDDYRPAGGILFPHRLTRSVAGETNEEWTFRTVSVNPALKPDTFEAK
jgi:hypothetical protein